jgi:uncharacterized protein YlxW (UPF0749 family)
MDIGILWLLIAAAVGFVVGWLLRAQKSAGDEESSGLGYKLRQRDEELAAVRAENTVHLSTLDTLRNEIATLTKKLEAYEHRKQSAKKQAEASPQKKRAKATGKRTRRS